MAHVDQPTRILIEKAPRMQSALSREVASNRSFPEGTAGYLPFLRLDNLWRIHAENGPVRWLLGESVVRRHFLDLLFDPTLARHLTNRDELVPAVVADFHAATAPLRVATHPDYIEFTALLAHLFVRYPALALAYLRVPGQGPEAAPSAVRAPGPAYAGPAGTVLRFRYVIEQEAALPGVGETICFMEPADPATDCALTLLHLLHGAMHPSDIGETDEDARRWVHALLATVRYRLADPTSGDVWHPVPYLRALLEAARRAPATQVAPWSELTAEQATLPDGAQRIIRAAMEEAGTRIPWLQRAIAPAPPVLPASVTVIWQPGTPFPYEAVTATMRPNRAGPIDHPIYGAGFRWDVGSHVTSVIATEIFPDRRFARLYRAAADASLPICEMLIDRAITGVANGQGALQLLMLDAGWEMAITVYANGDLDATCRFRGEEADPLAHWRNLTEGNAEPPSAQAGELPVPVAEAAAVLGFHPTYIKTLIRSGKLKGSKLGRNWFVDPASLAAFRDEHGTRAASR